MATTTSTHNINVTDNGSTAKVVKSVQGLNAELNTAERTARKLQAVHRAENSGARAQGQASEDSGMSRGLGGLTGAAGRDFAKQAQGLGGLVHVYATFAANIFALSAAFGALSKAADTTNMVKGLDQLGISSGRALGSLSKQLVAVTDSAINLRDAMTATAQASAGGMTNDAILRMGNVAKQASQALGVAMPDALSRISRGITKLEPELLDEIGIMVRVDKSSQDYARSLGKTASALTDFEKRQGFANAVLEQGEKKFGSIKIDANPYSKILASMENLAQKGLEVLNTVLTPILSILSTNPTALALAMAGVASILLKQALPAIGAFRESLNESAKQAKEFAVSRAAEARKGYEEAYRSAKNAASIKAKAEFEIAKQAADDLAQAKVAKVEETEEKIKKLRESSKPGTATYNILSKTDLNDITEADIKRLELNAKQQKGKAAELQAGYARDLRAWKKEELAYEQEIIAAQAKKEAALEKYNKSAEQAAREQIAQQGILSTVRQNQIIADRAVLSATSKSIVATAANRAAVEGLGAAWKEALVSVNTAKAEQGMGRLQGMWTMTKVGIVSATGAISTFLNFMGPWMAIIGIATAAFSLIDSWASTAKKEIESFDTSLTSVTDSTKLLSEVSNDLWSKGAGDWLTAESLTARANAMTGLSDSIAATLKNLSKVEISSSSWDDFWDGFLWTDSRTQKASKAIGAGIAESIELAPDSKAKDEYIAKITSIIGKFDIKKLKNLDVAKETLKELADADKSFSNSQANSAEIASKGTKALVELDKVYNSLKVSLTPTDNMFKFGDALLNVSSAMRGLSKDTELAFQEIVRLANTPGDASKFGSFGKNIVADAANINKLNEEFNSLSKSLLKLKELQEKVGTSKIPNPELKTKTSASKTSANFGSVSKPVDQFVPARDQYVEEITRQKVRQKELQEEKKRFTEQIGKIELDSLNTGLKAISASFNATLAAGALKVESTLASAIAGEGGIKAREAVALKEIDLRTASNNIMVKLITAQEQASIAMERNSLTIEKATVQNELKDNVSVSRNLEKLDKITKALATLDSADKILSGSGGVFSKYTKAAKGSDDEKAGAERVKGTAYVLMNAEAQAGAAELEKVSIRIKATLDIIAERSGQTIKKITDNISKLDSEIKSLESVAKNSSSLFFENVIEQKTSLKFAEERLALEEEDVAIAEKYAEIRSKIPDAEFNAMKQAVEGQLTETKALKSKKDALERSISLRIAENAASKVSKENALALLSISKQSLALEQNSSSAELNLESLKNELEYRNTIGAVTSEQYIKEKSLLDIKAAQLAKDSEINKLAIEKNTSLANAGSALTTSLSKVSPDDSAARLQLEQEYRDVVLDILAKEGFGKTQAESRFNLLKSTTEKQAEYNSLVAKQNEDMKNMVSITESLSSIFGELGTNIGKAGEAILKMSQDDTNYLKQKAVLEQRLKDPAEEDAATRGIIELEKKHTKDQLTNLATVASYSKKLFKEETVAYKVLDGLEKTSHAIKMVNMAIELGTSLKNGIISLSNFLGLTAAKDAAAAPGTLMSFVKEYGPTIGIAAGAAFLANLGISSGGGGGIPAGMSAEDRQKTQGTGTVFGDSEAKSKSLTNSLEILTATSIEGLSFSSESVALLEKINLGIEKVGNALAGVDGITTGTIKGIVEGSSSSGGGLLSLIFGGSSSSTSVIDSGIRLKGTFLDLANAVENSIKQYNTVATTSSSSGLLGGLFGGGGSSTAVSEVNAALPKTILENISGVFSAGRSVFIQQASEISGSMTPSIVDSVLGTLDISGLVSLRGLKGDALKEEFSSAISAIMDSAAAGLFPQLNKFRKVGEGMSETVTRVLDGNDKVMKSFTSIGKAYTKLPETFAAVPKEIKDNYEKAQKDLDDAKKGKMQSVITGYSQGEGEYFAQYAEQLVIDQDKVTESTKALQAATALYNTAVNASTTNNADVTQALIDNAGGLENYLDNIKFFGDTFLTEAERLKPIAENVSNTLSGILGGSLDKLVGPRVPGDNSKGYASELMKEVSDGKTGVIDTREEFKRLYLAVDVTKEEGRDLIKALDDLAPSFDKMVTASEKLTASKLDQYAKALELLGDKETALALTRQRELDSMDEALRPAQKYIYALQDQAAAQGKIKTIYEKTTSSIKNTASQIKSLDDAINSLKLGQSSVLTPQQKYAEAKAQIDVLQRAISNTGTDQTSIDAKNDALGKLPAATNTFLDASKVLFASGTQYTQDFNSMLGILSSNKLALENQRTLEQQTVDNLKSSNTFLASIDLTLADLPNAIAELLRANNAVTSTQSQVFDPNRLKSIETYVKTLEWGNPATERQSANSVYAAAQQHNVTQAEIAAAMKLPYKDVIDFFAKYNIPAFADGGLATGLSLVGERGPELVDFKTPGRVYSNTSSNDMFANSNRELVAEVRALRDEVVKLREEQKQQTGHIIATNYDANAKVANAVTESVESNATSAAWANRSQVRIA